jgi:endonuclease YncB( thermonuclease family)
LRARRKARRSFWRSLADGLVLLALAVLVAVSVSRTGWLSPESGRFTAIDGDSLRKGEQEYRLHGIDAPELNQSCTGKDGKPFPCGRAARDHLRSLVKSETLDCDIRETDRYGRLVAECRAGDLDINREMVRSGWAIAYRRHGTSHADAESAARAAGRGIWQGEFETPERWRERRRKDMMRGDMGAMGEGSIPVD